MNVKGSLYVKWLNEAHPVEKAKQKKTMSQKFFLVHDDRKERVCRDIFTKTLDIKRKTIDYTLARKKHGAFAESDMRGKSSSTNKLDPERLTFVKKTLNLFPQWNLTTNVNLPKKTTYLMNLT